MQHLGMLMETVQPSGISSQPILDFWSQLQAKRGKRVSMLPISLYWSVLTVQRSHGGLVESTGGYKGAAVEPDIECRSHSEPSLNRRTLTIPKQTSIREVYIMPSDTEAIRATLSAYRDSLVTSDVDPIVALYTEDGATMAQHSPTQVGHAAIKAWYTKCFEMITLNVIFNIEEVVVVSDKYAFARTTSSGTVKINAIGQTANEANQELFVMEKVAGDWKIARYCFCTTNPPK
jgi:uncharacterized protein (TIGR02246 family)